jgi:aspartyl-tRNA(Asn)/glutamyl-tRNA(Gln) amidotransferase subunit C
MSVADFNIQYVSKLARIHLTEEEEKQLGGQLHQILNYIAQLQELDVTHVEPTAHAFPLENVARPDVVQPSLSHDDALRNAPSHANGLFLVPKIVE